MCVDQSYPREFSQEIADVVRRVHDLVPMMRVNAEVLDRDGGFPVLELNQLRSAEALSSVIPKRFGSPGIGFGTIGTIALFDLLRTLGRGNLAVGRIFEGHVNALKLIFLFGNEAQSRLATEDVRAGHLFAIWNAEQGDGVRLSNVPAAKLAGTKVFCSGAGYVTRALITASTSDGVRMLLIPMQPVARVGSSNLKLHGMRAAQTGVVPFDGVAVSAGSAIGEPGDYTREPTFSAGAWRTLAVILGGIDALMDETQRQLISRDRHKDPHQLSRMGRILIARESARLWIRRAACIAENDKRSTAAITGYVNLARTATESAALDVICLIQRTLGLAAFLQANPVERLMRDLATYLRQPAADEALTEAAAWFTEHPLPDGEQ
jgi:alkylation response protein AidB-like acyl-CoA dehydrogenase